jgi:hypothetical protein
MLCLLMSSQGSRDLEQLVVQLVWIGKRAAGTVGRVGGCPPFAGAAVCVCRLKPDDVEA